MIEFNQQNVVLTHDAGIWSAIHDGEIADGPRSIRIGADVVAENCSFHIDDLTPASAVLERFRAHHRAGAAIVESEGVFPFGNDIRFSQTWRYAANHARATFDLNWPRDTTVQRHFGLGGLFLPGPWKRFFAISPPVHLDGGAKPIWREIANDLPTPTMIAHWHRPPLAVVFERPDGTRLEVGAGSDLWRWEHGLGYGSESGSYKITREEHGIRFTCEPLMCCQPFTPPARQYRFTWHLAWQAPTFPFPTHFPSATPLAIDDQRQPMIPEAVDGRSLILDLAALAVPATARKYHTAADYIRNKTGSVPCWESKTANKAARAFIRRLAAKAATGHLRIKGLLPQPCHAPGHVDKKADNGLLHWDINAILDLTVWARRQLGDGWIVRLENRLSENLPSLRGIELANGFATEEIHPGEAQVDRLPDRPSEY